MYRKGDVVLVVFPYSRKSRFSKNSEESSKPRPALIIDVEETPKGNHLYRVCQITHVDRRPNPGIWVERGKKYFVKMGVENSSFINLATQADTTASYIYLKIGFFADMVMIDEMLKKHNLL